MVHVNYVAVLVAAVAVFVLGWLWYSPLLFFKPWMRLRGMDPVAAMAGAKMPAGKLLIELVRCLVLACVIARLVVLLGVSSWMGAVHFGFLLWIGFPVVILDRKSTRLNSSHDQISYAVFCLKKKKPQCRKS